MSEPDPDQQHERGTCGASGQQDVTKVKDTDTNVKVTREEPSAKDRQEVEINEAKGPAPKGISNQMWEKFQELQKRRMAVNQAHKPTRTRRNSRKRQTNSPESHGAAIVNTVEEGNHVQSSDPTMPRSSPSRLSEDQLLDSSCPQGSQNESWSDIKQYLNVNEHLKGASGGGKPAPPTKLEKQIEKEIAHGNYSRAEELSDKISTQQFGKKITDAFDAKRYAEKKKHEEDMKAAKRKKKLHWGWEAKQRWETKGNM